MTEMWTMIAGVIPAGLLVIAAQVREELLDSTIRKSRLRAIVLGSLGRPGIEVPDVHAPGPLKLDQVQGEVMFYHKADEPQPCCELVRIIAVQDDPPSYDLT
jgi:hypothetical protein